MPDFENEQTALLRDRLTGALIGLARAADGSEHLISSASTAVITEGLSALADEHTAPAVLERLLDRAKAEKRNMVPDCFSCACPCGRTSDYDMAELRRGAPEVRALKMRILSGLQRIAAHAPQAETAERLFYRALFAVGMDDWSPEELLPVALETEEML